MITTRLTKHKRNRKVKRKRKKKARGGQDRFKMLDDWSYR